MTTQPLPVLAAHAGRSDPPALDDVARDLAGEIEGEVRFGAHDRLLYATDASMYQVAPIGVVVPATRDDVVRTVAYCARRGVPILPRGGGTSLAGQVLNTAIVIDFSAHCDRLLDVDERARVARVEPGLVLDHLNAALRPKGLMFGPDVATSTHATLGGMIGNNSAGAHSVLYGRTVENVRALEIALSAGETLTLDAGAADRDPRVAALTAAVADVIHPIAGVIDDRYPRTRRRVNGYNLDLALAQLRASTPGTFDRVNLAQLLCGSEGTLGVTLEATVGLVETPRAKGLAIIGFADVDAALAAVNSILATGPAAVELIDDVIIDLAGKNLEHRRYVERLPAGSGAVLYVEHFADDAGAIERRFEDLRDRYGTERVRTFTASDAMAEAWKLRKAGEPLLHGQPGRRKPVAFIEDMAVDPARLPEFITQFREIVARHDTTAAYYAHASVGCLHIRPMICLTDPDDLRAMTSIIEAATDLVMSFGGALSGEHGDGRLRSHLLERFYGAEICAAFRAIKAIFDPRDGLNPGNIVTPLPMTEHLRVHPADRPVPVPDVETYFRYDREHGFGGAVEMCNGAGVCRKTSGGTMCPSYRATRDERHATRGRGNALRLAITGQLGTPGPPGNAEWNDAETLRTLDLCLSCKACKSECPSNVDIAKLKAEYLAQGYRATGRVPLAARVTGHIRRMNRLAGLAPRLTTALARSAPGRGLAARLLDVDPRRSLPGFERSLLRWFARRAPVNAGAPTVVLFADCFTTWNETAIGRAAVASLESLGYRVVVEDAGCCGRSMISTGMLADAAAMGARTAGRLATLIDAHDPAAILFCEPSCLSAVIDDWRGLRMPGADDAVAAVADRASLIEDFVERGWDTHPRQPALRPLDTSVRLHGHCHQKALWSVDPTRDLLRRVVGSPGCEIVPAGCCGMAGAFGFGRERFDLSMQIAELELLPDLRLHPDALVAAPGTSCRHQIRDALGRDALHPIELLDRAIGRD